MGGRAKPWMDWSTNCDLPTRKYSLLEKMVLLQQPIQQKGAHPEVSRLLKPLTEAVMAMSHRVSKRESETTPSGSEEHPAGACRSWTVGLRASVAPSRPRARRGNPGPTPGGDPAGEGLKQEMDQVASVYNRFVGIPGNGRRISYRLLHVWEFVQGRSDQQ
jgi:hypothetical protein